MKKSFSVAAVAAAIISIAIGWSFRPALLEEKRSAQGDFLAYRLGTSSHLFPAARAINWIFHPVRKHLIPLNSSELKSAAVKLIYGYDAPEMLEEELFGDLASWDVLEEYINFADSSLHFLGRFLEKDMLLNRLAVHVYIAKRLKENPEINDETIERPIFLASYTRSGGTFLYQVLSTIFKDEIESIRHLDIMAGPFELPGATMSRREKTEAGLMVTKYLNPPMSLIHEYTHPDDPEEDSGWYGYTFTGLVTSFLVPSRRHLHLWLNKSYQPKWHDLLAAIMRIKQFDEGRKLRFILKAPEHLIALPALVKKFPDAKVVVLDREELPMYKSGLIITHQIRHMLVEPNIDDTLYFMDILICAERKARDLALDKFDVLHFKFSHLFNQTYDYVEQFAKFAQLPWDDKRRTIAKEVIHERLSWKKHKIEYKIDEFGVTDDGILQRLSNCEDVLDIKS